MATKKQKRQYVIAEVTREEKALFMRLAKRLGITESDAVRKAIAMFKDLHYADYRVVKQ